MVSLVMVEFQAGTGRARPILSRAASSISSVIVALANSSPRVIVSDIDDLHLSSGYRRKAAPAAEVSPTLRGSLQVVGVNGGGARLNDVFTAQLLSISHH
jgi:hypothetical protein